MQKRPKEGQHSRIKRNKTEQVEDVGRILG